MFLAILYTAGGLYLLLMAAGLLHRAYMKKMQKPQLTGLIVLGGGFLILGLYYSYFTYYMSTPEGKAQQHLQNELNRRAIQETR